MKEKTSKFFRDDFIFYVLIIIVLVIGWFTPKSGTFVLIDELFNVLFVWCLGGLALFSMRKMRKSSSMRQRLGKILLIIVIIVAVMWFTKDITMDVSCGINEIELKNVEVSKQQGKYGFISLRYHLDGTDENGNRVRFEISADDYSRLLAEDNVWVEYYKYTDRVYRIR